MTSLPDGEIEPDVPCCKCGDTPSHKHFDDQKNYCDKCCLAGFEDEKDRQLLVRLRDRQIKKMKRRILWFIVFGGAAVLIVIEAMFPSVRDYVNLLFR